MPQNSSSSHSEKNYVLPENFVLERIETEAEEGSSSESEEGNLGIDFQMETALAKEAMMQPVVEILMAEQGEGEVGGAGVEEGGEAGVESAGVAEEDGAAEEEAGGLEVAGEAPVGMAVLPRPVPSSACLLGCSGPGSRI